MKFISVKSLDVSENVVRVDLIGDDQKRYPMEMAADVAGQLLMALRQAATRLEGDPAPFQTQQLYTISSCQPIAVENDRQGILIHTTEKFEIPLVADSASCAALRACIDQIERGIRHEGPVH